MKRSQSLAGLSREHHAALVLAIRAQRIDADDAQVSHPFMAHAVNMFEEALEPHFRIEETVLLPLLEDAGEHDRVRRTMAEHEELRRLNRLLGAGDAPSLRDFGRALESHVRFEERELFVVAESLLTAEALAAVGLRDRTSYHPILEPES